MKLLTVKTARFSNVVAKCGAPHVVTLWQDPAKDRDLQRLIRENKLLTLHQTVVGSKKDFGEVGYVAGPNVSFLAFPKSLKSFAGRRIIGVDYSQLEALPDSPSKPTAASKSKLKTAPAHLAMEAPIKPMSDEAAAPSKIASKRSAKRSAKLPVEVAEEVPLPAAPLDPFMLAAINEARKSLAEEGIPIGAALVRGKKLLAVGHNKRVQDNNPVAHAETDCLRNAGRSSSLRGCTLYVTLMPCFFCAGAAVQFGIKRVIVGESRNFAGASDFMREHGIEVVDLDLAECYEMMARFIREQPKLWREDLGQE